MTTCIVCRKKFDAKPWGMICDPCQPAFLDELIEDMEQELQRLKDQRAEFDE